MARSVGEAGDILTTEVELTDDLIERIASFTRAGNFLDSAAVGSGVSWVQFQAWYAIGKAEVTESVRNGKPVTSMEAKLYNEVEKAVAQSEAALVVSLRRHADEDSKAAIALLQRRFPGRWG